MMVMGGSRFSSGCGKARAQLVCLTVQATENPHYKISVGVL